MDGAASHACAPAHDLCAPADAADLPLRSRLLGPGAAVASPAVMSWVSDAWNSTTHGAQSVWDGASHLANEGSEHIHGAETWVTQQARAGEDAMHQLNHDVIDNNPVPALRSVGRPLAAYTNFLAESTGGAIDGAARLVGGTADSLLHPINTVEGMANLAMHSTPGAIEDDVYRVAAGRDSYFSDMVAGHPDAHGNRHGGLVEPYRESYDQGRYGEIVGRGIVDVGSFFIPGGGEAADAAHAVEAADVAHVAEETAGVAHVAEETGEAAHVAEEATEVAPAPARQPQVDYAAQVRAIADGTDVPEHVSPAEACHVPSVEPPAAATPPAPAAPAAPEAAAPGESAAETAHPSDPEHAAESSHGAHSPLQRILHANHRLHQWHIAHELAEAQRPPESRSNER
jgi:hypothetical protein